jgi:hypothetical protein
VSFGLGRLSYCARRSVEYVEASVGPATFELIGMHLGAPALGIVEVSPSQHMDPPDPSSDQIIGVATQIIKWVPRHHSDDTPLSVLRLGTMRSLVRLDHTFRT